MKGANLWREFRAFALKGNVIDLALAVIIGGAFGAVINSLVKNVIMPILAYLISFIPQAKGEYRNWKIGPVEIGIFLSELLNFFLIAGALFFLFVKVLDVLRKAGLLPKAEPATRKCPLCLSDIPLKAKKCAHCTADLPLEGEQPSPP